MKTRYCLWLLLLVTVSVIPLVFDPNTSYVVFFLFTALIYIALAHSWNLVGGYTGLVSLGHNAFFGFGAYLVAIPWFRGMIGYLDPLGFLFAGCGAAILALIVGIPLLSKLRGDYFALGTLGLGEILRMITIQGDTITGGSSGVLLDASSFTTPTPHYYIALFLAVLAMVINLYMSRSRIGLALIATRDDEAAAQASGVNILKYKVLSFVVGAFIAGLCGGLQAYFFFNVEPQGFYNLNWTLYPVLMCVLGGPGTVTGPVIGATFLTIVFEVAKYWLPEVHPIVSGLLVILTIIFLPKGLMGLKEARILRTIRRKTENVVSFNKKTKKEYKKNLKKRRILK